MLSNRKLLSVPRGQLALYPAIEFRSKLTHLALGGGVMEITHRRNERFQLAIPESVTAAASAVIGFDTSSWILAKRCHRDKIPFILDQTTPHRNSKIAILDRVREAWPEWSIGVHVSSLETGQAERIEHNFASLVVAASSFTVRTLVENGVPGDRIRMNPYGVDMRIFSGRQDTRARSLRFVFVGSLTAAKGLPVLLEAWRRLRSKSAELWLIGSVEPSIQRRLAGLPGLRITGSVPHSDIASILQQCDVFVFPSYYEGFGGGR